MKICVISFDFWDYDAHIVDALRKKGVEAHHLKIGAVGYDNLGEKIKNAFSKTFLKRNLKHEKRQKFVIDELKKLGYHDQILVLNPDSFDDETLAFIRKYTNRLITFLYDNLERFPVEDKLHYFDKIYAFDDADVEKHGFEKLTNYNYLPYLSQEKQNPQMDIIYITSCDKKRIKQLFALEKKFEALGLTSKIFVIGKKSWWYKISSSAQKSCFIFRRKLIKHKELPHYYKNCKVIIDLMRENQYGLSFRIFEAMAMEKKIITDNEKIQQYDFYHPQNILILNKDFSNLAHDFFETPYLPLAEEIYEKYTLGKWVERVFELK